MMPTPVPPTLPGSSRTQEARLLVALLRSARLSLLYSESGANASAFLSESLLPLLQRRLDDRSPVERPVVAQEMNRVVVPFPDRRQRHSRRPPREVVVVFDNWDGVPLAALLSRLQQAIRPTETGLPLAPYSLVDSLRALGERDSVNFIIVLDRFESFLRLPPQRAGVTEFTDELVQALNTTQLPANFLLALDEEARPALDALRRRIPGFDDYSLRLPSIATPAPSPAPAVPALTATPPSAEAAVPPVIKRPSPLHTPVKTQDVYALIEATLNNTVADSACEPFQSGMHSARTNRQSTSPLTGDVDATTLSLRTSPTLINRCKSLATRLWRRPRDPD